MFGSNARATWGTSQWGAIVPGPGAVFSTDAVCSGDLDRLVTIDALAALLDQEADVSLDGIAEGAEEVAFAVDAAPALLPPEVYAKLTTSPYVLAELELPAGPIRVATTHRCALAKTWSARLLKSGNVLRSIGRGTDDLRLELDDTTSNGAERFRDLFAADHPEGSIVRVWLGADGATDAEHVLVFEGKLNHVQSMSDVSVRISVVRREQVEDVLLGRLVDEVSFPNAPAESISSMLPIVFGVVDKHEGVVIDTLETGTTLTNVFLADLFLDLVDASEFPAAGTVKVNGEEMIYTGKQGNRFVGVTRGANGTNPTEHSIGSEVVELGPFSVQFASHSLGIFRTFKLLLPNGNLGDPVPQPSLIDAIAATATWPDGLPQIRDPDARPSYRRIHFKDEAVGNTAINARFASRENVGYEAFKVAQVPGGSELGVLTNTEDLGEPGDITRAWICSIHDRQSVLGIIAFVGVGTASFILNAFDTVPDSIARNDEKTGDRIYDVPPPVVDVSAPALIDFSATPQTIIDPGLFVTADRAGNVVDKDDDSFACYQFVGFGEAIISGGGDVVLRWSQQEWENAFPAGSTAVTIEIRALMGATIVPITSPWEVFLQLDGVEVAGTRLKCQTKSPAGGFTGFISGVEEFKLDISGKINPGAAPDAAGLAIYERLEMVLHPVTGVSTGIWCADEVSIQGQVEPALPVIDVTQDVKASVTNYFEVTDQLLVVDGRKSWASFSDVSSLGTVRFKSVGGEPRIIETFWVVEFTPFVAASSRVPRTFADVSGLVSDGDPVEIARQVITRAAPEGMGLPAERIDSASYLTAQSTLQPDGVRLDFALKGQSGAVDLLSEIAAQADSRDTWENRVHRIVRLPLADTPVATVRTIAKGDVLDIGPGVSSKAITRSGIREVANRITVTYRPYAPSGQMSQTFELNDAASQASNLGLKETVLELGLVQDEASATLVSQRKLERIRVPRWVVSLDVPIYALSYRPGDLVAMNHPDFSFMVGEVTQVNLSTDQLKHTRIQIVVWDK